VRSLSPVIAGLDPAIHHFTKNLLAKKIDHPNSGLSEFGHLNCASRIIRLALVKPAGDAVARGSDPGRGTP